MRVSPYQGLPAFEETDAGYFFGRQRDARLIAADLFASPLTVLYGASGVGKSSLLRAGVIPLLKARRDLVVVLFAEWQGDPVAGLRRAAEAALATVEMPANESLPTPASSALDEYLLEASRSLNRRVMVILDQFEEYFLYHPHDDDFGRQFARAANLGTLSVSFLLSMREEALARLDRFEGRIRTLFDNYRRVDHLDREAGREAIERPLRRFSEEYADVPDVPKAIDPSLVDMVLDEVSTGRVQVGIVGQGAVKQAGADAHRIEAPYLQLVMTRLWEAEREVGSQALRADTLSQLGHAQQIVKNHLDAVMSRFSDEQQDIAARAFQLLVTPSGTKIAHSVRDLSEIGQVDRDALRDILESLSAGTDRILRPVPALSDQPDDERYEIFHDRLALAVLDWRARRVRRAVAAPISKAAGAVEPDSLRQLESGIALSLSGGGYRAMLFHAGAIWRLNDLGFLPRLDCIASVSVSSFLAALLGRAWWALEFDPSGKAVNLVKAVIEPVRRLARTTLDSRAVFRGLIMPLGDASDALAKSLAAPDLLGEATLQDLPEHPRFVIVATNLQTGAVWRFQRRYLGDYLVGRVLNPTVSLAAAAAASAAIPPVLSPCRIRFDAGAFGPWTSDMLEPNEALRREVFLADGAVVDKLAIETTWQRYRTILVSDATGKFAIEPEPNTDWARQSIRVLDVIDNQLVQLRRRQIVAAFAAGERLGTYWGIRTAIADYGIADAIPADPQRTGDLATISSRMAELDESIQERLINWGYAISDAALRRHLDHSLKPPVALPYPNAGI